MCVDVEQSGPVQADPASARSAQGRDMSYHQSLRWVLTDSEAARLAFDTPGAEHPWTRAEPWFVRLRHEVPMSRGLRRAS